jgi:formylglycine-generating enzyme required for sulfatase activity
MSFRIPASIGVEAPALAPSTVAVPGGSFLMGCETGRPDEAPVHEAEVADYRMAVTPVTVRQYALFLAAAPVEPPPWWSDPAFGDPEQPVVGVSWFEAVRFGEWLARVTGEAWRLPTEAEWERAARGGLAGAATAWGPDVPAGEIPGGPLRGPWRVGQGTANPYGLFDMGTIVHEWCEDVYRPYGAAGAATDAVPSTPSPPGSRKGPERRASRGGSWRHQKRWSSPAARSSLPPALRYADYGFRLAMGARR